MCSISIQSKLQTITDAVEECVSYAMPTQSEVKCGNDDEEYCAPPPFSDACRALDASWHSKGLLFISSAEDETSWERSIFFYCAVPSKFNCYQLAQVPVSLELIRD